MFCAYFKDKNFEMILALLVPTHLTEQHEKRNLLMLEFLLQIFK